MESLSRSGLLKGLSTTSSGSTSSSVWNSAMRFCTSSRIRLSPVVSASALEAGSSDLP